MDIRIENLVFGYSDETKALNDVSLTIEQGEHVALIGHNGSGKTSLVKHLNGLLRPSMGKVWIGDSLTERKSVAELTHQVALLFQNPDDQISKRRVWDEVAFGPKNLKFTKDRIQELVDMSLALFDLSKHKDCNPYDLGYSERKRLALASIIAMDTPIVVLDEPTAGLDSYEIGLLKNALDKLHQETKTVIIISHDMDFVAERIPRAICLKNGKKVFDGAVRKIFNDKELLTSCRLLQPQIVRLSTHFELDELALTPVEFLRGFRN
ncbi:MAG: energy-coupling factor ABC transporter ATP-binding protein [Desulfotalea sp.]